MIREVTYRISEIAPYINWLYFFHAWSMTGKDGDEKERLRHDALSMLEEMDVRYHAHALVGLFDANSDGDDILLGEHRFPMLRQQHPVQGERFTLCLSDFLRPLSSGIKDKAGAFVATVDAEMENLGDGDIYRQMLAQTLSDRLAEAATERLHETVRRQWWGYAPDENLTIAELHREAFQGIRPAVGYPSLPDTSVNFLLFDLLDFGSIGVRLTETGMMMPHASVSGFMFAHPKAHYFDLGPIGEDQLADYARRRGVPLTRMRQFIQSNLMRK